MNEKFHVQVSAPNQEAFARVQECDFDMLRHTARRTADKQYVIDGLLTADEAAQLVRDGYAVQMERLKGPETDASAMVVELPEWLAERGF